MFLLIGQVFVGLGIIGKTLNALSLIAVATTTTMMFSAAYDVAFGEIVFAQEERSIDRRNRAIARADGRLFGLIPLLLLTDIFALTTQNKPILFARLVGRLCV